MFKTAFTREIKRIKKTFYLFNQILSCVKPHTGEGVREEVEKNIFENKADQ